MCKSFGVSRSGYYKSLNRQVKEKLKEDQVIKLVQEVRRIHPRMGGKKLYGLLESDLKQLEGATGRDKFFDILGRNKLLVKRRRKYVKTTDSWHYFIISISIKTS